MVNGKFAKEITGLFANVKVLSDAIDIRGFVLIFIAEITRRVKFEYMKICPILKLTYASRECALKFFYKNA